MTSPADAPTAIEIDFTSAAVLRRIAAFKQGRELVQRACAVKNRPPACVFDATAGYANDSIALALLGAEVTMVERCPEVAAALVRALEEGKRTGPGWLKQALERIRLVPGNSIDCLGALNRASLPDVVMIDPMFPEAGRSALSKRQLEALRALCGDDDDAPLLLEAARKKALHKVVVKRRLKAPRLSSDAPSCVLKGTTIRYDIYVTVQDTPRKA